MGFFGGTASMFGHPWKHFDQLALASDLFWTLEVRKICGNSKEPVTEWTLTSAMIKTIRAHCYSPITTFIKAVTDVELISIGLHTKKACHMKTNGIWVKFLQDTERGRRNHWSIPIQAMVKLLVRVQRYIWSVGSAQRTGAGYRCWKNVPCQTGIRHGERRDYWRLSPNNKMTKFNIWEDMKNHQCPSSGAHAVLE